jgi:hypothetical protein
LPLKELAKGQDGGDQDEGVVAMPRMIDLIRASAVPSSLMHAAARGALSIPESESIEILVHLAVHNKIYGNQARLTLAGWNLPALQAVLSESHAPPEILAYFTDPSNLRPEILASLVQNTSVREEALAALASSGSRDTVEKMVQSPRALASATIRNALRANPQLSDIELATLDSQEAKLPDIQTVPAQDSSAIADDVLDEQLMAYLSEHSAEITADPSKPFQAIGGIYDELDLGEESAENEILPVVPANPGARVVPGKAAAAAKPAAQPKKATKPDEGNVLQKIAQLDVKGRIQLAMKGTKEERSILIRDGTKVVALAVLESPKITDGEVERFANQKNVLEAVLRAIPMKRRFAKHYPIVRNLVGNPRTPLDLSLGLMKNVLAQDLRALAGNKEVSETVRKLAMKMFKQKTETRK